MDVDKYFSGDTLRGKVNKHEKKIAKECKGRRTIGSGNLQFDKGDVKAKNLRIELKRTDNSQIVLKKEWLSRIMQVCGKDIPAVNIQIQDLDWYIVRKEEFEYLREKMGEEK